MKNRLFIYILFLFIHFSSFATSYNSAHSGLWNNSSTWSPAGVPGIGDNVTILSTHTVTTLASPQSQVNNLTINIGGTLTTGSGSSLKVGSLITNNGTFGGIGKVDLFRSDGGLVLSGTGAWTHTGDIYFSNTAATTQIIDANVVMVKTAGNFYLNNSAASNNNEWVTNNGSINLKNGTIGV
ncbi:MAG TPA: hypothetical protein VII99_05140, partial [Bacteroidia bacterium]